MHEGVPGRHHHHRQRHHSLKERVIDRCDPITRVFRVLRGGRHFDLKTLAGGGLRALAKAERYRLLNEPSGPKVSASTRSRPTPTTRPSQRCSWPSPISPSRLGDPEAWSTVGRLRDEYERAYYTGIIHERRAKALPLTKRRAGSRAHEWIREAMANYERAGPSGPRTTTMRCCD
jgi:hypothetical protein